MEQWNVPGIRQITRLLDRAILLLGRNELRGQMHREGKVQREEQMASRCLVLITVDKSFC